MRKRSKGLSRSLCFDHIDVHHGLSRPHLSCSMKCVPGIASKATKVLHFRYMRLGVSRKHQARNPSTKHGQDVREKVLVCLLQRPGATQV